MQNPPTEKVSRSLKSELGFSLDFLSIPLINDVVDIMFPDSSSIAWVFRIQLQSSEVLSSYVHIILFIVEKWALSVLHSTTHFSGHSCRRRSCSASFSSCALQEFTDQWHFIIKTSSRQPNQLRSYSSFIATFVNSTENGLEWGHEKESKKLRWLTWAESREIPRRDERLYDTMGIFSISSEFFWKMEGGKNMPESRPEIAETALVEIFSSVWDEFLFVCFSCASGSPVSWEPLKCVFAFPFNCEFSIPTWKMDFAWFPNKNREEEQNIVSWYSREHEGIPIVGGQNLRKECRGCEAFTQNPLNRTSFAWAAFALWLISKHPIGVHFDQNLLHEQDKVLVISSMSSSRSPKERNTLVENEFLLCPTTIGSQRQERPRHEEL